MSLGHFFKVTEYHYLRLGLELRHLATVAAKHATAKARDSCVYRAIVHSKPVLCS